LGSGDLCLDVFFSYLELLLKFLNDAESGGADRHLEVGKMVRGVLVMF
jgi:hypothetical protein